MTILFIQPTNPAQAVARFKAWIPELVHIPTDDEGTPLPEALAINRYTDNYYMLGPYSFLRRRPDPPADPEAPPDPLPPGHLLEDVYTVKAYTDAGKAVLDPIRDALYVDCLKRMTWRTAVVAPGLLALPIHTHAMRQEQSDARRGWQLIGEEIDTFPPKGRAEVRGKVLEREGVRVDFTNDDKIRVRGPQGDTTYEDAPA